MEHGIGDGGRAADGSDFADSGFRIDDFACSEAAHVTDDFNVADRGIDGNLGGVGSKGIAGVLFVLLGCREGRFGR